MPRLERNPAQPFDVAAESVTTPLKWRLLAQALRTLAGSPAQQAMGMAAPLGGTIFAPTGAAKHELNIVQRVMPDVAQRLEASPLGYLYRVVPYLKQLGLFGRLERANLLLNPEEFEAIAGHTKPVFTVTVGENAPAIAGPLTTPLHETVHALGADQVMRAKGGGLAAARRGALWGHKQGSPEANRLLKEGFATYPDLETYWLHRRAGGTRTQATGETIVEALQRQIQRDVGLTPTEWMTPEFIQQHFDREFRQQMWEHLPEFEAFKRAL